MYKIDIDEEKLERMMQEIEDLQAEVDKILYNKNPFYRWFYLGKAKRLHEKYKMKMLELFYPTFRKIERDRK